MNDFKTNLNIILACLCCVLGTVVYLTHGQPSSGCKCDQSAVIRRLDELRQDVGALRGRRGSPIGSPLGSPE